jgi:C4-dicarboxylate-specific signal transduction histidine kinase
MSEDVTARVQQRQREAIENRLASLGLVAGGIAHELNSPLQTILLAANELLAQLDEGNLEPADMKEVVETIVSTSRRAAELTTALRTLARKSSTVSPGQTALLSEVLRDVGALSQDRVASKQLRFEIIDRTPFRTVRGRASELAHVLLNLVNNASDAVPAHTGWLRLETDATDAGIRVRCIDSGSGIDAKHQARLMEPFFTTKGVGEGTGLGLSIAYQLARKNEALLRYVPDAPNTTFELQLTPGDGG